jgi:hypothetical protein
MDFSTILFGVAVATLFAWIGVIVYQRNHAPTTPQYKTVSDMNIKSLVFFRTETQAAAAFTRMHDMTITDKTVLFLSDNLTYWYSMSIKTGSLTETQVTNERLKQQFVQQTLIVDCSDTEVDALQEFLSWLRNSTISAYAIAADGTARRLENLEWLDYSKRALVFQATSASVAAVVGTYQYNVLADGSHSFYNAYNGYYGGYTSGGQGIGYWLLG